MECRTALNSDYSVSLLNRFLSTRTHRRGRLMGGSLLVCRSPPWGRFERGPVAASRFRDSQRKTESEQLSATSLTLHLSSGLRFSLPLSLVGEGRCELVERGDSPAKPGQISKPDLPAQIYRAIGRLRPMGRVWSRGVGKVCVTLLLCY